LVFIQAADTKDKHPFNGLFFKTTWVSWHRKG